MDDILDIFIPGVILLAEASTNILCHFLSKNANSPPDDAFDHTLCARKPCITCEVQSTLSSPPLSLVISSLSYYHDHTEMCSKKERAAAKSSFRGVAPWRGKHTLPDQNDKDEKEEDHYGYNHK